MADGEMVVMLDSYQLLCPHGGMVTCLPTTNRGPNMPVLETDVFLISGCPFMLPSGPSPCVRVVWVAGLSDSQFIPDYDGKLVYLPGRHILVNSVGLCLTTRGAPQGNVVITGGVFRTSWTKQVTDAVANAAEHALDAATNHVADVLNRL